VPLALTGYEIGLLAAAAIFIVFALIVSMVIPRRWPEFPARGFAIFVGICVALFAVQMGAVLALAELGHHEEAEAGETPEPEQPEEPEPEEPTPTDTEPQTTDETETTETETTETETETTETETGGSTAAGEEIFVTNCASCHTLADAGTSGTIGPNLDAAAPSFDRVVDRVTNGAGAMPSFADTLSEQQIQDVAAYVSAVAG
jgi:cytochrome c553